MTIASSTSRIGYTGDGVTTAYAAPFFFSANSDLVVSFQDLSGNVTTKLLGTDYNLTGAGTSTGGTCTFVVAPTTGFLIAITRVPPITQTTSYNNNDPFPAKSHENALDKATTIDQYLKSLIDRAILVAPTDNPPMTTLPPASVRALKNLSFDSLGNPTATVPATGAAVSAAMIPVVTASTTVIATGLLGVQETVVNRAALMAIDTTKTTSAYLIESGREGKFVFRSGNFAARVTADTQQGIYIAANAISTTVGAWVRVLSGSVNPFWFGAVGDQTTDDAVALQAAATAAVAIGGELFLPVMFKTLTAISITGHISVRGVGFQSSPINYGFGATANAFDTRASGFKASGLICGVTNSAFSVATTDSVSFQNFHVTYPTVANAGVSAFLLNSLAGDTGCNMNSIIKDVLINNAYIGITVNDWLQFEFNNIYFVLNTLPIIAQNTRSVNFNGLTRSASCGDGKIINCTFMITQGAAGIQLLSGSGYRIANNKFQGSNAGLPNAACILISPQNLGYAFSMTPGIIADNSFEGFGIGLSFSPNAASQGTLSLWEITGNEFFCTVPISMASGIAIPQWMGVVNISSNVFTYGQGGSSQSCVVIAGAGQVMVSDNVFAGAGGSNQPSVSIGLNTSNLKIGNNIYNGTALGPPVLTPTLPASTVGVTNTTGYTVTVNVYGGTVSSVLVNIAGYGGTTVSQVTNCSVVLNPNDQIVLTYSVGPAWTWRALNP